MGDQEPKPSANGSATLSMNTEASLQHRYTSLLETRIAQLEAIIKNSSKHLPDLPVDKDIISTFNDTKNDNDKSSKVDHNNLAEVNKQIESNPNCEASKYQKKDENKKAKSRYRIVVRQFDKVTRNYREVDDIEAGQTKTEKGDVAFTFRRLLDSGTGLMDSFSEIDIEDNGLREMLKEQIGGDYPGQNFDGDTVNMTAPFAPLVHNWTKLEEAAKPNPDEPAKKQAREDLERLLECVTTAPELEQYFKTRESNLGASITTYQTMWTLFAPKTKIVAKPFLNILQIFEVAGAPLSWDSSPPAKLNVLVWCWDWNGKEMIKVYYCLPIKKFRGTIDINQLLCYPVDYHKDGSNKDREELFATVRERGARYSKTVRSKPGATQMYAYNGEALSESQQILRSAGDDSESNTQSLVNDDDRISSGSARHSRRKQVSIKGKFIVDPEAFLQYGASSHSLGEYEPVFIGDLSNLSDEPHLQEEPCERVSSEEDFLLYPPRVLGYSTKEKMWGQFEVDRTSNAPGKQIFKFKEKLQLDDRYKLMIQALIDEHEGRAEIKDVVEDKGKGLVLLLHGPPGVGKTLTAETIAEATGKPLFVVSVAEIGLNASKAEKNLEQMFYLAGKWEAVLLVDEADVFLEMRSSQSDPNRNALVSVLLRVLEYYHGIMILTTNRVTAIDIAVQSRIHLAIRYDDLTKEQKRSVFKLFLNQLKPESIKDKKSILEFIDEWGSEYKLNGRQIRNVMSSALSLARSSAKEHDGDGRLTEKHLKRVLTITKDFQEQLEAITTDHRATNEATRSRK